MKSETTMHSKAKYNELMGLRKRGVLKPEDIVEFARSPKTALHSSFEWDDTKAGHEYRLWQARQLIVSVKIKVQGVPEPVQAFVSLKSDRGKSGGYRELATVLGKKEQRDQLLQQALEDFEYWQERYQTLNELVPVFSAAEPIIKKRRKAS